MTDQLVTFDNLNDSTVRAKIDIKASPEKVYAAWTNPEILPKWFGPRVDGSLEIDEFNCTVGGKYDLTMVFADGDRVQLVGTYQEVEPPKKLVFTWQWKDSPTLSYETLVTVDLAPSELGTQLTLTHERFTSVGARNDHHSGWEPILARLARILAN